MSDSEEDTIAHMANFVARCQQESMRLGALGMWTVYDRPADRPTSIVARKFEVGNGVKEPIVTDHMLVADASDDGLTVLRNVLERAGLVCLTRNAADHPNVVETWI